ncbi:MAG: L,D-transpeptidase family protein [Actinomycetota bacterium]|nr:L,D-transpeptidase family protein [Actinomycetota bacterium]
MPTSARSARSKKHKLVMNSRLLKSKKFLLSLMILILLICGWGTVYATFPRTFKLSPVNKGIISTNTARIHAKWSIFMGEKVEVVKALLDGKDVTDEIDLKRESFSYIPGIPLEEGEHRFFIKLKYRFLLSKDFGDGRIFIVDTQPPVISFKSDSSLIATRESKFELEGRIEPGARLRLRLNGKSLPTPTIRNDGSFYLDITLPSERNILKAIAIDLAGNKGSKRLVLVVDRDSPIIREFSPDNKSVVKTSNPMIKVQVEEANSEISEISLRVDGVRRESEYDPETESILCPLSLAEGKHSVELWIKDAAGNSAHAKWDFTVDSAETLGENAIAFGARGADVTELQAKLIMLGFDCGVIDGVFGPATRKAVEVLQEARGLPVSGIVASKEFEILRAGKLPGGPIAGARIVIQVSKRALYLYQGENLLKVYPIAVGRRSFPTPIGHFRIIRRDINPTWYPPGWADVRHPIPPGPGNPLGNRRLLLSNPMYGIHGTNRPSSIGKAVTHGCIRMYPSDILELFDAVSVGTPVDMVT